MGASQIQAGKAYVAIYGDNKPLQQAIKKLAPEVRKQGEELSRLGESTASAFAKGNTEILSTYDSTKAAATAFQIAALASSVFQSSAGNALTSTAIASNKTALATQAIVDRMNKIAPASKGFASAFGAIAHGNTSLVAGALGVNSIIQLLKAGGPAAKPLLDIMAGIVGQAKDLEQIKPPRIAQAFANDTGTKLGDGGGLPVPEKQTSEQLTVAGLAAKLNQTYARVYGLIKSRSLAPSSVSGSTKLYDQAAIDALAKAINEIDSKKPNETATRPATTVLDRLHEKIRQAATGTTANLGGMQSAYEAVAAGATSLGNALAKPQVQQRALALTAGVVHGAIDGVTKSLKSMANVATLGGLSAKTALQAVANKAQWASLVGSTAQRQAANAMRQEANAAAIGEAFTRGWIPGIAKYVSIVVPDGIKAGLKGVAKSPISLSSSLLSLAFGGKKSVAELDQGVVKMGLLSTAIEAVRGAANGAGGMLSGMGRGLTNVMLGAVGAITALAALHSNHGASVAKRVDTIASSSANNNRSLKSTSEVEFAAASTGTSLKSVDDAFEHLGKVLDKAKEGESDQVDLLNKLGLSAEKLGGLDIDEKMKRVGQSLENLYDPLQRDKLAVELLGKEGAGLVPMLTDIDNLRARANAAGAIVNQADVDAARQMSVAMASLKTVLSNAWNQIGAASVKSTTRWITGASLFIQKNQGIIQTLLKIVAGVGAAAAGLALWAQFSGPVLAIVTSIGAAVTALMSPIGLVMAAVAGGVAVWGYFSESGKQSMDYITGVVGNFFGFFQEVWSGIVAAIGKGDLSLAGEIAWTGLQLGCLTAFQAIGGSWSAVMETVYGAANIMSNLVTNIWADIAKGFRQAQNVIAKTAIILSQGVGTAFATMFTGLMQRWNEASNTIGKGMLTIAGKLTGRSAEDMASDQEAMDQQRNFFNEQSTAELNKKLGDAGTQLNAQLSVADEDSIRDQQKIDANRKSGLGANDDLLSERMKALKPDDQRVAELKSQLDGMITQAKSIEANPNKKPPEFKTDELNISKKDGGVAGTFNSAAAGSLGGGNAVEEATKSTAKDTAAVRKALEKILEKADKRDLKNPQGAAFT